MLCLLLAIPGTNIGIPSGAGAALLTVTVPIVDSQSNGQCGPDAYILLSKTEYSDIAASPFNLALADGAAIAGAVMLVWAFAYGIRSIIRVVRDSGDSPGESE